MEEKVISGIIETDEEPLIFHMKNNDFKFYFLPIDITPQGEYKKIKVPVKDSFICGETYDNHKIAIYRGDLAYEILNDSCLYTAAYVKSTSNIFEQDIMFFDGISFSGKILNGVFNINGFKAESVEGKKVLEYSDDSITYNISTDEYNVEFDIHSITQDHYSATDGKSISNSEVVMTLKFSEKQPLIKVFEHYNKMRDLISFMIYRGNVDFDNIFLMQINQEKDNFEKTASVHIRRDINIPDKKRFHNITFNDLGESLPSLIKLIYDSKEGKQSISLGFLPPDDEKVNTMTNDRVRLICSAIECELNFVEDLNLEKDKLLKELAKQASNVVKDFKKQHSEMKDSDYNSILTSIGYWSLPLSEKVKALFRKYEEHISKLNRSYIVITEGSVGRFIQYRNDITHGKHRTLDEEIAMTGHLLCGLIYCCVLERIGVDEEKIKSMCNMKILW